MEDSTEDDQPPQDNASPDPHGQPSLDMDGFTKPTRLPRRFRSSTQGTIDLSEGAHCSCSSDSGSGSGYNCRSFSVQEEPEEVEEEDMQSQFRSRRVSI
jgi:hypothetical protein